MCFHLRQTSKSLKHEYTVFDLQNNRIGEDISLQGNLNKTGNEVAL